MRFAALHESAHGTKPRRRFVLRRRLSQIQLVSAVPPKADIVQHDGDVRRRAAMMQFPGGYIAEIRSADDK